MKKHLVKITQCSKCWSKDLKPYAFNMLECNCGNIFRSEKEVIEMTLQDAINKFLRDNKVPDNYDKWIVRAFYACSKYKDDMNLIKHV